MSELNKPSARKTRPGTMIKIVQYVLCCVNDVKSSAAKKGGNRDAPPDVEHAGVNAVGGCNELRHIDLRVSQPSPRQKHKGAVAGASRMKQRTAAASRGGIRAYDPSSSIV